MRWNAWWVMAAGVALVGCGLVGKSDDPVPVSGQVTLDGGALADGIIYFVGADGAPPESGTIRNGSFRLKVRPGRKRVEVRAFRNLEPPPPPPANPEYNYLPARYNSQTTLLAEVTPDGKNDFSFAVESK
jgi:hypothetical protein